MQALRPRFEISLRPCLTVSHVSVLNSGAGGATLRPRFEISLHSCLAVSHVSVLSSGAGGTTIGPRFEISLHSCLVVSHDSVLKNGAGGATLRPRCQGSMALVESQEVGAAHHIPPLQPLWRPQNQQKRRRWGFHHALQPAVQSEVSGGPHEAYRLLLTGVQAHCVLCCSMTSCISLHQAISIRFLEYFIHGHGVWQYLLDRRHAHAVH